MEKTMNVAKALYDMYYEEHGMPMDEMKMHKLMYFLQRESLMKNDEALFDGSFYGWRYGPVLREVRQEYRKSAAARFKYAAEAVSSETMDLLRSTLGRYGALSSWKLSSLSHEEFSWKHSRTGLNADEDGSVKLLLDAMRVDAVKEKMKRKH